MTVIDLRTAEASHNTIWTSACPVGSLIPGRGVAVLLRGGRQAALFLLESGASEATGIRHQELYAVGNIDPFGRAAVMSRGIVGDRAGEPTVASPLLKQVFSLLDGRCLDNASAALPVYNVRLRAGVVEVCSHTREVSAKAS